MFSHSTRISGEQTDQATVAANLGKPHQIFHFTGHGNYNFNSPKHSALALINQEQLTLEAILKIPFPEVNYEIVTLSACETALTGNQSITTEYVGLVSGFLRWGTSYVLSTQWQVEDAANALVTIQFYRLLLEDTSLTPPLALAKTIRWLRDLTVEQLKQFYQELRDKLPKEEGTVRPFLRTELSKLNTIEPEIKMYDHPYYWAGYKVTGNM